MSSTPAPAVPTLLHVLRAANARYSQLAAAVRGARRPTHHARKRAQALQLSVSITAARKCDPRQVSVVPLPVLERAPSPAPAPAVRAVVPQRVAAPAPVRPVLRCVIPRPAAAAPEAVLRSRWSSWSSEESASESEDDARSTASAKDTGARLSWASASGASSSSASSSSGPVTPENAAPLPALTLRIKRKSSASFLDMDDDAVSLEKRPKYERKRWVQQPARRTTRSSAAAAAAAAAAANRF